MNTTMRSLTITILAVVIAATGMYSLVRADVFSNSCDEPITYQVGSIDSQFSIGSSTVRNLLADAEETWEESTNKNLFAYTPEDADLVVEFVYDQRQRRTQARNEIASDLSSLADSHDGITSDLAAKQEEYEQILADYETARRQYETNLANFNERVRGWNQESSVPEDVQEELITERDRLATVRESLSVMRSNLIELRDTINQLAERSNSIAETYNQKADTFASRFGSAHEFNQATYENDVITVYQYQKNSDLRLALTHEFGHALSIQHVNDPQSVMYHLMEKQSLDDISLTSADQRALRNVCGQ